MGVLCPMHFHPCAYRFGARRIEYHKRSMQVVVHIVAKISQVEYHDQQHVLPDCRDLEAAASSSPTNVADVYKKAH